ncbi:MAG: SOS response-associated peptidase [Pirellulaceae bacterium]
MCGRFTLRTPNRIIAQEFMLGAEPQLLLRFNIAPTQDVAVVRLFEGERVLTQMRWGLVPFWADDPSIGSRMINARGETIAEKPSFRNAYKKRRCLVVADGFYEWTKGKNGKQPYFFHLPDHRPFAFAGLWESWDKGGLGPMESCTIVTTHANEQVRPLHHRMPVILEPSGYDGWLANDTPQADVADLLVPLPEGRLVIEPVSTRVNSPRNDDEVCTVVVPSSE